MSGFDQQQQHVEKQVNIEAGDNRNCFIFNQCVFNIKSSVSTEQQKDKFQEFLDFDYTSAEQDYRAHVKKIYGEIRILGKLGTVPLEGMFTDVYLLDKPSAYRRFDLEKLHEDTSVLDKSERLDGLELVKKPENKRLYILGKPGAGKTTFLRYLALEAANNKLNCVPVLISLKEWAYSGLELMPFVLRQLEICRFPNAQMFIDEMLKQGKLLMLFDGLDEVSGEQRDRQIQNLKDFSNQYVDTQILITCRIAASSYSFERFTYVELADFSKEQQRNFGEKWFHDNPINQEKFFHAFALDEHKNLCELARNPMLMGLLCLVFSETGRFPNKRGFYEEAITALLKGWDDLQGITRDKIHRELSAKRKIQLLSFIAANTFEMKQQFILRQHLVQQIETLMQKLSVSDCIKEFDGESILRTIETHHGLLIECAKGIYSFSHQTFQEHFTARYFVDNECRGVLERLMEYVTDSRWQNVFILTSSMLPNTDNFFNLFLQSLERSVMKDKKLTALLKWAEDKVTDTAFFPHCQRFFYIFMVVSIARIHALTRTGDIMLNERPYHAAIILVDSLAIGHTFGSIFGPFYSNILAYEPNLINNYIMSYVLSMHCINLGSLHFFIPSPSIPSSICINIATDYGFYISLMIADFFTKIRPEQLKGTLKIFQTTV